MFNKTVTYARNHVPKPTVNNWGIGKGRAVMKKTKEEKARMVCEHCQVPGHEMNDCFKLHGYPDWYKKLKEQKGKQITVIWQMLV